MYPIPQIYIITQIFKLYFYQYQQFLSQSNSPSMPHVVQMDSSGVQLNDQELAIS